MSVSGTFSIRMRTVPETSLGTSPLPVGCRAPPLPAQPASTSAIADRSAIRTTPKSGRPRRGVVDRDFRNISIAALFLSLSVTLGLFSSGAAGHGMGDGRDGVAELTPRRIGEVVDPEPGG